MLFKCKQFITFEGMDGCGKSTAIKAVKDYLESCGEKVIVTREPGGTSLAENLRGMLKNEDMALSTEITLFTGARLEHLHKTIYPALNEGAFVLCDRYVDSTFVYQIKAVEQERLEENRLFAKAVDKELPKQFDERQDLFMETLDLYRLLKVPFPEKTYLLDVSVETSLQRRDNRGETIDKFEQKTFDDLSNLRTAYLELANMKGFEERIAVIDANVSPEKVVKQIIHDLKLTYPDLALAEKIMEIEPQKSNFNAMVSVKVGEKSCFC